VDRGYFRPVARPEDDLSRDRLTRAVEDLRGEREHGIDGDGLLVEDVASEVDANGRSAQAGPHPVAARGDSEEYRRGVERGFQAEPAFNSQVPHGRIVPY